VVARDLERGRAERLRQLVLLARRHGAVARGDHHRGRHVELLDPGATVEAPELAPGFGDVARAAA
jgi:predicted nucleotidyltransferase